MKIKWTIDYKNNIATSKLLDVAFSPIGKEKDIYSGEWYNEENKEASKDALLAFAKAVNDVAETITFDFLRSGAFTKDDNLFAVFVLRIHPDLENEIYFEDAENVMGDSRKDITRFYTLLSEEINMDSINDSYR